MASFSGCFLFCCFLKIYLVISLARGTKGADSTPDADVPTHQLRLLKWAPCHHHPEQKHIRETLGELHTRITLILRLVVGRRRRLRIFMNEMTLASGRRADQYCGWKLWLLSPCFPDQYVWQRRCHVSRARYLTCAPLASHVPPPVTHFLNENFLHSSAVTAAVVLAHLTRTRSMWLLLLLTD